MDNQGAKLHSIEMNYNQNEKEINAKKNLVLFTITVPFEEVVEIEAHDFVPEELDADVKKGLENNKKHRYPRDGEEKEVFDRN